MIVLAFDTATADTVVGLRDAGGAVRTRRHTPGPGERPGHAAQLLPLARALLAEAGLAWGDVARVGVGTGPGTFTGLRIGVATARALVQAGGQELAGVGTLEALARGAATGAAAGTAVLGCLDARRGEAWVAAWRDGAPLAPVRGVAPEALGALTAGHPGPWLAAGDGSVRFRAQLEAAGVHVPPDASGLHHVDGAVLCELALAAPAGARDSLEPEYVRAPDAVPKHLR